MLGGQPFGAGPTVLNTDAKSRETADDTSLSVGEAVAKEVLAMDSTALRTPGSPTHRPSYYSLRFEP
jgi:hypothetical protein